ncbi:hypothetical protein [Pseudomonas veronii]|uniref:hypothetical protein n=1 Tax=Pseudomonas veronii TaxID=76761 RepID=UPI0021BF2840|nr:hypothetical protein [Pseudomonas veronii]MCT9825453.1 hypothetical protein [Pseudomonas veronii]
MSAVDTGLSESAGRVDMTVGYTDPVIGVTAWPVTTVAWSIQPPAGGQGGAQLALRVALQPGGLVPTGSAAGNSACATATDIAGRFGAVWYQLMQPDMTASLTTSLNQPPAGQPVPLPVSIDGLRAHVSASYAYALAASALDTVFADPASTATLASVLDHYGVDWQALGLAADERTLGSLVQVPSTGLQVPSFAVFVAAGSIATLVPAGLEPATVLADADNTSLPLNPGTELAVTSSDKAQPTEGLSLAALALALNITPASLVSANHARPALLAPGFIFTAQGIEVEVPLEQPGADATLDDIALAFRNNGVPFDTVMAAVASSERPGMFRSGATLAVDRQIIAAGWTLADNDSGIDTETLASLNAATVDLFAAGTPIFLQASAITGLDRAPLGATARAYAIEPGDLLRHNAGLAPKPAATDGSAGLPIPGFATLPATPASLRIPYRVRAGQSMSDIAGLFLSAASDPAVSAEVALTVANQALPGTVAAGQTLTVAGQTLTAQAGESFNALIARANPAVSLEAFATAIANDTTILAGDALLLCPPAKLTSTESPISPKTLSSLYGLEATLILSANAASAGLMAPDITLRPSPVATHPTVTTVAADSLNAIIRRFALAGISVTLGDIVQANRDVAFLASDALLLLPPADTLLTAAFGGTGWQFPEVIFPLRSWVTLARDPAFVDPAFRGATVPTAVEQVASPIAAARDSAPERQEDGAVTLDLFAKALEEVILGLKLATGRVFSAERDPAPTDIWAVSFVDPGGISAVTISPSASVSGVEGLQPLSFALRPLSSTLEAASGVPIKTLDPSTGTWGPAQLNDYQGIDLEIWARAWLAGLDLLCTSPYAAPAYGVAAGPLGRLLAAKKLLACAVADGLSPVLADQVDANGVNSVTWAAAREVLYQRLLSQLVAAYNTTAIIQFNATVTSPPAASTARLSGAGRLRTLNQSQQALRLAAGDDPDAWKVAQLGNAKTALGTTTHGTVSFALDVAQPARHRAVALSPVYVVNEIEFGIAPVVAGYEASNWLSFVRAFDQFPPAAFSAALGAPLVPVPLRAYPELPALVSQTAEMARTPDSVDAALHWNYVFTYTHQSAAQDQILLEVEFNRTAASARFAVEDDSLFNALAQYAAVSDGLWQILAELQGPNAKASNTRLATALDTYAGLAERVAGLWSGWWGVGSCDTTVASLGQVRPPHRGLFDPSRRAAQHAGAAGLTSAPSSGAPHEFYHYLATLDAAQVDGVDVYLTLTLQRLHADGSVGWPDIEVICDDGTRVPLSADTPLGDTQVYHFPGDDPSKQVPAFSRLGVQYTLKHLHIARYQNANAAVSVIRNAQLLGPEGPQTCTAFVYRTPQLSFPEPLVPLISVDSRLAIGTWTQSAASNPLTPLFEQMFDNDFVGRQIAVSIRYGYTLVPSTPPIETMLPVKLHPRFTYDQATTVQSIIDAVAVWAEQADPVSLGGLWGLRIVLYSTTDPSLDRPLLELQRVVSPIV